MLNKIKSLKLLSTDDMNILIDAFKSHNIYLCKNMSIFSKKGTYKTLGDYNYFETNDNEDIYYLNMFFSSQLRLFIDSDKKILYYSRFFFNNCFIHFIDNIDLILKLINDIKLDNTIDIGTNIISIQKWFVTYGHYKDEAFNLCNFYNIIKDNDIHKYTVLHEYHTDSNVIPPNHYPVNTNYILIDNYLFINSINAYKFNKQILKMKKVYLIEHHYISKMFHSFPLSVTTKILSKVDNNIILDNVFITRNKAVHMPRMLDNFNEIENHLISLNFTLVNPELLTYDKFISSIRNANKVVITWGGALTNMIYLKENTKVIILQSKSYEKENIHLFKKIIDTYKLNITIIKHSNNMINLSDFNYI